MCESSISMTNRMDGSYVDIGGQTVYWRNTYKTSPSPTKTRKGKDRMMNNSGYVLVYKPDNPTSTNGWILEHRYVMEQYIGRPLESYEIVHHVNHKRDDNRIENLRLTTKADHWILDSEGSPNIREINCHCGCVYRLTSRRTAFRTKKCDE